MGVILVAVKDMQGRDIVAIQITVIGCIPTVVKLAGYARQLIYLAPLIVVAAKDLQRRDIVAIQITVNGCIVTVGTLAGYVQENQQLSQVYVQLFHRELKNSALM